MRRFVGKMQRHPIRNRPMRAIGVRAMNYRIWLNRSALAVAVALLCLDAIPSMAAQHKKIRMSADNQKQQSADDQKRQFTERLHNFAKTTAGAGTPAYFAIVRRGLDSYDKRLRRGRRQAAAAPVNLRTLSSTPDAVDLDSSTQLLTSIRLGIRPDTSERIVGGWPAKDGQFGQAVMLQGNNFLCSGVALDSATVLTAAHCACDLHLAPSQQESEALEENKLVWVGLSNASGVPRFRIDVKKTIFISNELSGVMPCPDVLPSVVAGNPDLALIGLQAGLSMNVPQVKIATSALFNASIRQSFFYVVGFGCTSPLQPNGRFLKCDASSSGTKFAAVINKSGQCTLTGSDGCSPGNREFVLQDSGSMVDTCAGDSGGPAIVFNGTGFYVAGITSRAWDPKGKCGPGGIYENITTPEVVNWLGRHVSVQH